MTGGVARAIGYWINGYFADFMTTDDVASSAGGSDVTGIDGSNTDPAAVPVGALYFHVPNGKLYYNGEALKDSQNNELGYVASVVSWGPGERRATYALIQDCTPGR